MPNAMPSLRTCQSESVGATSTDSPSVQRASDRRLRQLVGGDRGDRDGGRGRSTPARPARQRSGRTCGGVGRVVTPGPWRLRLDRRYRRLALARVLDAVRDVRQRLEPLGARSAGRRPRSGRTCRRRSRWSASSYWRSRCRALSSSVTSISRSKVSRGRVAEVRVDAVLLDRVLERDPEPRRAARSSSSWTSCRSRSEPVTHRFDVDAHRSSSSPGPGQRGCGAARGRPPPAQSIAGPGPGPPAARQAASPCISRRARPRTPRPGAPSSDDRAEAAAELLLGVAQAERLAADALAVGVRLADDLARHVPRRRAGRGSASRRACSRIASTERSAETSVLRSISSSSRWRRSSASSSSTRSRRSARSRQTSPNASAICSSSRDARRLDAERAAREAEVTRPRRDAWSWSSRSPPRRRDPAWGPAQDLKPSMMLMQDLLAREQRDQQRASGAGRAARTRQDPAEDAEERLDGLVEEAADRVRCTRCTAA